MLSVLQEHREVFSSKLVRTPLLTHYIITDGPQPPPSRGYRATDKVQEQICTKIQIMLDMGVIKA